MLELHNHFIGTYGKNLLAEWSAVSDLILKQTAWVRETIQEKDPLASTLLSDRQMNDAFNGPFHMFFKSHLAAYASIAKVETALTFSKEDFFKEAEQALDITLGVPENVLSTIESSALKSLRDQVNEATQQHYKEWETHIQTWLETLLAAFQDNKLPLSDLEIQDFSVNQPASELHDRFVNLKLTLPKLGKTHFNFQQYFTLQATLTIQSALSRLQRPNTDKDIEQVLKLFQTTLKKIHESEKELANAQQKILDQLTLTLITDTDH